ncbi:unnamed protein product [Amoebophrya sp. A120]|nr:unnamed protein product [Amoebophrya sp. A120]|eukprot:GSA120T00008013001.1
MHNYGIIANESKNLPVFSRVFNGDFSKIWRKQSSVCLTCCLSSALLAAFKIYNDQRYCASVDI